MKTEITHWKLKELAEHIEIVSTDAQAYKENMIQRYQIPLMDYVNGLNRAATTFNWSLIKPHYLIDLDNIYPGQVMKNAFQQSILSQYDKLTLLFQNVGVAVSIPMSIFINDWEEILLSTFWETMGFTSNPEHFFELTRDFVLHSSFPIFFNPSDIG